MKWTQDNIENIKLSVDLVDLIQREGIELKPGGQGFKGLCPFHPETTPSFFVWPESARWKCFGCQAGGDVFDFLQMFHGLNFSSTLKYLTGSDINKNNVRPFQESWKHRSSKELLIEYEIEMLKKMKKLTVEFQNIYGNKLYSLYDELNAGELQPVNYFTQYHLFEYILAELDQDRLNQNRELKFLYRKRNRLYGLTRNKNGRVNENKLAA